MGLSVYARAWRAGIIACGLAWFGPVDLRAETPEPSAPAELIQRSAEPFGLAASSLPSGGLRDKWLGVQRRLDDEMVQLALCEGDRDGCVSPAALKFLDIVDAARSREGRARLGEINRAINLAIRPMSDLAQHGQIDVWTLAARNARAWRRRLRGLCDCEIRRLAPRRPRARRSQDRGPARYHPWRGPCGGRRAAGRTLADARQPPHGDGRGCRRQKFPADIRDRPARRDAIRRCPPARRRRGQQSCGFARREFSGRLGGPIIGTCRLTSGAVQLLRGGGRQQSAFLA